MSLTGRYRIRRIGQDSARQDSTEQDKTAQDRTTQDRTATLFSTLETTKKGLSHDCTGARLHHRETTQLIPNFWWYISVKIQNSVQNLNRRSPVLLYH